MSCVSFTGLGTLVCAEVSFGATAVYGLKAFRGDEANYFAALEITCLDIFEGEDNLGATAVVGLVIFYGGKINFE